MLTSASQYAIRAILFLAINSNEDRKIGVKTISEALETPQPFLAKLLQKLTRNNLVSSLKGPTGGFYLDKENLTKSVWDVIKCVDNIEKLISNLLTLRLVTTNCF